jgi:hypothetical protein
MTDYQDFSAWFESGLSSGWLAGSSTINIPGYGTIQISGGSSGTQGLPAAQPVATVPTWSTGSSVSANVGLVLAIVLAMVAAVVLTAK